MECAHVMADPIMKSSCKLDKRNNATAELLSMIVTTLSGVALAQNITFMLKKLD